jgi:hypothetical protein
MSSTVSNLTSKNLRVFFLSKLPQNSPYSKQGGLYKLGVFFSTSNYKIL